jgi:glycosyltransferase involved in cell wall biosynthesis
MQVKGGKLLRSFNIRRLPASPVPGASPPPALERAATIPLACGSGWGRRIWREPAQQPPHTVANIGHWDLCEIGYKLANGFLAATDWGYWTLTSGTSWVTERAWYKEDVADPQRHDRELQRDIVALADIIHVNERHGQALLADVRPGKRMVVHHHGVAYRDDPGKYERQEVEAGYTRLVSTPDLLIHGKPRYRKTLQWLPSPLDLQELDRNFPQWQPRDPDLPLVIAHGFTIASNKGTQDFLRIVDECVEHRSLDLEIALINRVQRRQALWYIAQCDVYFGTFLFGPGLASYEAMAFGKPVLVGCTKEELAAQRSVIGNDLPFIHVTPETLAVRLSELAHDAALREEWGQRGRRYIEKFHDLPVVVERARQLYEQTQPARCLVQA